MQMELSGWLPVTSDHGQAQMRVGLHTSFSELLYHFAFNLWDTQGLPHLEGLLLVEKDDSVSPAFLVLTIIDKALEALSAAVWEALSYHISTGFLDRRNGQSC